MGFVKFEKLELSLTRIPILEMLKSPNVYDEKCTFCSESDHLKRSSGD